MRIRLMAIVLTLVVVIYGCATSPDGVREVVECADPCTRTDPGFHDEMKKAAISLSVGSVVAFLLILILL